MKEIKLMDITLENFKGCPARELHFAGHDAVISGANGTGKTTIYNALTWLLFDKIADGSGAIQSNPDIKPNGTDGQTLDHAAVSTVAATLSVEGELITLKRSLREVWTQQRGNAEKKLSGNTSEYFWNDVPIQLNEFKSRLDAQFCPEELFWTLSNAHWFCRGMDWKTRRNLLAEVCNLPDDRAIMAANPEQFSGLADSMGSKTMPDYRAWIDAQIKKLNSACKTYPARLDEVKKSVKACSGIDFPALQTQREIVETQIAQHIEELFRLDDGTELQNLKNQLQDLKNKRERLEMENAKYRQDQKNAMEPDQRPALQRKITQCQADSARAHRRAESERRMADTIRMRLDTLRAEWRKVNAATFTVAACPTCGQTLPPDAQKTASEKFQAEKEKRKADILESAKREKENLSICEDCLNAASTEEREAQTDMDTLTAELKNCPVLTSADISDMPDYDEKVERYKAQIAELEQVIVKLGGQQIAKRENIRRELDVLRADKQSLDGQIAKKAVLKTAKAREAELREQARKTADELTALEGQRAMCDDFLRFKAGYIDDSVSGRFRTVRFRMFQPQINGGLKDCCDVYVDGGRLGHGLNTGAEYNAGIDVINVLSEHYGIRVPLFIDGAESISNPLPIDTQVIRLQVADGELELKLMEVEKNENR